MFRKVARFQPLGTAEVSEDGFLRVARKGRTAGHNKAAQSYFLDGARKLDVRSLLKKVASQYAVSGNPRDYIFEAIRANTTNTPNENHDGFHQTELFRFDKRIGMPVYQTYIGKPHHVNHKTENPKAARGVVIDAHYHDETPPLNDCPRCHLRTAARKNRDETGIHCRRCGFVVRDEFVEILVGVDTVKDPIFAKGVRTGQLSAGSMGCNCLNTSCNVCGHIAYSRPEFCEHIRGANKGTLWQKDRGVWTKAAPHKIAQELRRRRYEPIFDDFCYVRTDDGFEVRKAFEYCQQVIFDEYSRVDQPADPKALQREILTRTASVSVPGNVLPSPEELRRESELLIQAAQRQGAHMPKAASRTAQPLGPPAAGMPQTSDFIVDEAIQDNVDIVIQPSDEMGQGQPGMPGAPGMPEAPGAGPQTIDQFTQNQPGAPGAPPPGPPGAPPAPGGPGTAEEFGIISTEASAPRAARREPMKFVASFEGWTCEVSAQGNARIKNAKREPILIVRGAPASSASKRREFGRKVMASVLTHGLVDTAIKMDGLFTPRMAQVVDGAIDDMQEFADKYMHDSVLEEAAGNDDMNGDLRGKPPTSIVNDEDDDMAGDERGTPPKDVLTEGTVDHTEGMPEKPSSPTSEDNTDMRDPKRDKKNLGSDSVLDSEIHDHAMSLTGSKVLGLRIAHKQRADVAWTIQAIELKDGTPHARVAAAGQRDRLVKESDLGTYWKRLDASASNALGLDAQLKAAQAKLAKKAAADKKAYEARVKKAYEAKFAKRSKEIERQVDQAKTAAVKSFCKAMRIVASRQAVDIEATPLKQAAQAVLGQTRQIGTDAATGQPIVYEGMHPDLVNHLVADLNKRARSDDLENLMNRAAETMTRGDRYLMDAEKEARRFQASVPQITDSRIAGPVDYVALRAAQTRQAAMNGNVVVTTAPPPEAQGANGFDKRNAIRGAVRGTLVSDALDRLQQPN